MAFSCVVDSRFMYGINQTRVQPVLQGEDGAGGRCLWNFNTGGLFCENGLCLLKHRVSCLFRRFVVLFVHCVGEVSV